MSALQTFAFCIDCWAMHYGVSDSSGVYTRDSGSSDHWDHAVHVFRDPADYSPPVRGVLRSLHRGELITDARMEIFSLALAVEGVQPNNGIKPDSERALAAAGYVPGKQPGVGGLSKRVIRDVAPTPGVLDSQGVLDFGEATS